MARFPTSDIDLSAEWKEYFRSLLYNSNGKSPSELPTPAATDLSAETNQPTTEEVLLAVHQTKINKAAELESAITAEVLQNGGDTMVDVVNTSFLHLSLQ